jgi:8-oxo-dGTP pyrophosphatase MutT (NUDIX family)
VGEARRTCGRTRSVLATTSFHSYPSPHWEAAWRQNAGVVSRTRIAVRVLLLDTQSRVLLFEGRDLADTTDTARWWFTAGGGVEAGESLAQAAERELCEETGHSGLELVGPFHRRELDFLNHGAPQHQVEHFFAARTDDTCVKVDGWTELERRAVTSSRWWTADELRGASVQYYPANLADLVDRADKLI